MREALLIALLSGMLGCAGMNQVCAYYEDGTLKLQRIRSTVIGTGETELVSSDCGQIAYSTRDTGFSDNAEPVLTAVTEAAMKGIVPKPPGL